MTRALRALRALRAQLTKSAKGTRMGAGSRAGCDARAPNRLWRARGCAGWKGRAGGEEKPPLPRVFPPRAHFPFQNVPIYYQLPTILCTSSQRRIRFRPIPRNPFLDGKGAGTACRICGKSGMGKGESDLCV